MKTVTFSLDDIRSEVDDVNDNLNEICSRRSMKWQVFGCIVREEECMFMLEQVTDNVTRIYKLTLIKSANMAEMEAEVTSHWHSNIQTITAFEISEDIYYALYCKLGGN